MRLSGVYFLMLVLGVVLVCFSRETAAGSWGGFGGWDDDGDDGFNGYGGYDNDDWWGGGRGGRRGGRRGHRRGSSWGRDDDWFDFD